MDGNETTGTTEAKKRNVVLDPGNLMLSIYTLAIGLITLFGGLLPTG
ncbi:MAG: hypothetical protein ACK5PS_00050 [Desulfopila sp.]